MACRAGVAESLTDSHTLTVADVRCAERTFEDSLSLRHMEAEYISVKAEWHGVGDDERETIAQRVCEVLQNRDMFCDSRMY